MFNFKIKKLARDIKAGIVFHSAMIKEEDLNHLRFIFIPLMLGYKGKDINDVGLIYEYYSKRLGMNRLEYPTFPTYKILTKKELKKLNIELEKLNNKH